ncbi:hypothetical protein GCM10009865_54410 [Aeromicrobium ponti]|uniref:DUF4297 domain-containing protein n=1 Tax=Cytobacillus oceanisediminis TaxID=665099 RepID=A0A562J3Y5_9BACI|nr:hypothetical protein [Cytobacillus oceanisediminis]TWH77857.1 hypothetical protein IQ19_05562 [Cytobacillus oceanisediminis]
MIDAQNGKTVELLEQDRDGGYYAIKGFLYQFDQTIMKVLENQDSEVNFENEQDIDYEDFVIQIKHKETQVYQPSKVKSPIVQLIRLFEKDNSKKFCLYCHFKDTTPHEKVFSLEELNKVLGNKKDDFSQEVKSDFINSFVIKFLHDYEAQFEELLDLIEKTYDLREKEMILYYHAIFRSEIFRLVIREKSVRCISKAVLDSLISKNQELIFYSIYGNYLSRESYEKLIRKTFFTHKTINIPNFERLFIIDANQSWELSDLHNMIHKISSKYYRKDKSPAPFICFRNINAEALNILKQELIDMELTFSDGTCFDGDRFRMEKLLNVSDNNIRVRFIREEYINELISRISIHEIYQFFISNSIDISSKHKHIKVQLEEIVQINSILN